MPYNKKLTDLNRSGSTGKYPTSLSIGQYVQQDLGWMFSRTGLTFGQ
jgi:hypothetical protein